MLLSPEGGGGGYVLMKQPPPLPTAAAKDKGLCSMKIDGRVFYRTIC